MLGTTLAHGGLRARTDRRDAPAAVAAGAAAGEHLVEVARAAGDGPVDGLVADDSAVAQDHPGKATLSWMRAAADRATRGYRNRPLPLPTYGCVTGTPHVRQARPPYAEEMP